MHKYFPDWYRLVHPDPSSELIEKRAKAVDALAKTIKKETALDYVRLVFGRVVKEKTTDDIVAACRADDASFPARDNNVELSLIAAAALLQASERSAQSIPDICGLGLACGVFQQCDVPGPIKEIAQLASQNVSDRSVVIRKNPEIKVNPPKIDDDWNSYQTHEKANQWQSAVPFLAKTVAKLTESTTQAASALSKLETLLRIQREESNMFWWAFSEYSRDLGKPIKQVGVPAACLIIGKELADITEFIPGPPSARAMLSKVLNSIEAPLRQAVALRECVRAVPAGWREQLFGTASKAPDVCPVIFTLGNSDKGNNGSWIPIVERTTGVKLGGEVSPVELAEQVYRETLLIRVIGA